MSVELSDIITASVLTKSELMKTAGSNQSATANQAKTFPLPLSDSA